MRAMESVAAILLVVISSAAQPQSAIPGRAKPLTLTFSRIPAVAEPSAIALYPQVMGSPTTEVWDTLHYRKDLGFRVVRIFADGTIFGGIAQSGAHELPLAGQTRSRCCGCSGIDGYQPLRQNSAISTLASVKASTIACQCGCGQTYPFYSGLLEYGSGLEVAFRVGHFWHSTQAKHRWLLLGSGSWFADETRDCWVILDSWVNGAELIARVQDRQTSPFDSEHIFDEHFLTRSEVLARVGALQWAIDRRDDLVRVHEETRRFILGES